MTPARPRIVHVIDRLSNGGMESVALTVIEQTRDQYDHVIVCLRDAGEQLSRAEAAGIPVHPLDKQPGKDPASYLRLVRRLRRLAPDIVHTYNIGAVDVAFWARLAGCRRIVHAEHGRDAADPTGRNRKYLLLRRALAPLIDRFVPVSADIAHWMRDALKIAPYRIRLIYNGIDTERFSPAADAARPAPLDTLPEDTALVGTVGRLDPVKGFDTLISAVATLRQRQDMPNVHLVIVGEGPERARLAAQIDAAGLGDAVTLTGQRRDTDRILQSLDVYVCSSIAEGIALTMLEAMACERPVVATAVGGNPELITPEDNGLLVPSRRPDALAEAIARLLADRDRAAELGRQARRRAVADFSVAAMLNGYRDLYNDLLSAKRR